MKERLNTEYGFPRPDPHLPVRPERSEAESKDAPMPPSLSGCPGSP